MYPLFSSFLLMLIGGCDQEGAPATPSSAQSEDRQPRPDVILVTLDTTRADHLGSYGYEKGRTETLDKLAEQGQRFEYAYSPMPLTIPAHSTLFTGLDVYRHGVRNNGDNVLSDDLTTLTEVLKEEGYRTAASVSAFVTQRQWGFKQGFDAYFDDMAESTHPAETWTLERPADQVVDDVLEWMESQEGDDPRFVWMHFYDPHLPYEPPKEYRDIEDPYDAELAFVDDQIQRVVEATEGRETLWVVTGDHGEGRGAHLEMAHGLFVYDATQRVPLFFSGSGVEPEVIEQPVGLVDIMPTLLERLSIEVPADLDGRVQPGDPHPLYLESYQLKERLGYAPHVGIVDGDYKLIATPQPELYHRDDLRESTNLSEQEPAELARMQSVLAGLQIPAPGEGGPQLDPETRAQLQALGYISGDFSSPSGDLPDPKDKQDIIEKLQRSRAANASRDLKAEQALLEEAIAMDSDLIEPRIRLAQIYGQARDMEAAAGILEEALSRRPDSSAVIDACIRTYGSMKRLERVLELTQKGLDLDPGVHYHEQHIGTLLNLKREREAVELAESFLAANPDAHPISAALGNYWFRQAERSAGKDAQAVMRRAEGALRHAAEAEQPRASVQKNLGQLALLAQQYEEALGWLNGELEYYPGGREARSMRAKVLGELGRGEEQLQDLEWLSKNFPENTNYVQGYAMVLHNLGRYQEALSRVDEALVKAPESPGLMLLRANILAKLDRKEEADATFEQAKLLQAKSKASGRTPRPGERAPGAP